MPRWSISPIWSSAKALHGSSSGIGPVDSPPVALRWSMVMQRKSFLKTSIALNTAPGQPPIREFQASAREDQQRKARADLHVTDADVAFFIERAAAPGL